MLNLGNPQELWYCPAVLGHPVSVGNPRAADGCGRHDTDSSIGMERHHSVRFIGLCRGCRGHVDRLRVDLENAARRESRSPRSAVAVEVVQQSNPITTMGPTAPPQCQVGA